MDKQEELCSCGFPQSSPLKHQHDCNENNMAVRQWTGEEWKLFQWKFRNACDVSEETELEKLTVGQTEHPEWYEWPCDCDLCRSYAD